jgi:hypothetical protein
MFNGNKPGQQDRWFVILNAVKDLMVALKNATDL